LRVLITGANGFLGSHLVEKSVNNGFETIALIRKSADVSLLKELNGFEQREIDFNTIDSISKTLKKLGSFDLVVHNVGLTKSYSFDSYLKINRDLTARFIQAIHDCNALTKGGKFIYISSMAALGPLGQACPVSLYGKSKLAAEDIVKASKLDYLIFRPTGIYGRRDQQFLNLFKAVKNGLYPNLTSKNQKITLIHAEDVAENVLNALGINRISHLDDGNVYLHQDMKQLLEKLMGRKTIWIKLPLAITLAYLSIADFFVKNFNLKINISKEQFLEISQDWNHDFSVERVEYPLTIHFNLASGFRDALNYYQKENLI